MSNQTEQNPAEPVGSRLEVAFKRLDKWLWQVETAHRSKPHQRFWHLSRVLVAVIRDLARGYITLHAMSLVYTTLLSLVPFLALSFSVLKGFGVHNQLEPVLQNVLATPLGERGPEVVDNILGFVDNIKVGVLGSVGLGLLIFTVVSLIQKIERSFNEIWRVSESRSLAQRFASYLSVIMIGPLLVFSAMGATAALVNSAAVQQVISFAPLGWLFSVATKLTPYLIIIGLFTFLYTFIPNTKVKLRHAFLGGLVAGFIWQTSIFGFTLFVSNSGNYTAIYSGFAVGILLLIWLYLAWLILLIGASVAFYSQHAQQITRSRVNPPAARIDEMTGLAIMFDVAQQFDRDGGGVSITAMESGLSVGPDVIQRIIAKLLKHNIVIHAGPAANQLVPARSLDHITLQELILAVRTQETDLPSSLQRHTEVNRLMNQIELATADMLEDQSIADWVRNSQTATH
ncbi:YihY/virulence factor BrkB family protein [Gilvimarinus agarilyticus]|uniref:YihY/virulence factor BrkB family protein n=1 Tax=unclassified Gilvimarinus TaxID=2642066 RepID=UPI001C09CA26|nr:MULTISPECIES: YihY/virulence factor BrkB family protein [unclassified Gilvimarinus]MBU2885922.1 YihY/virulence factor BrkB family protein [Gilvimarinus agarilyticus]MDO6570668.1 YihY/virulence factor BrkB family protein [Gilvimarinus sp. 2_MG-2023]MDO6747741.1 YihY/virulence factor BrkB family protein [Gilvimarinus sp. 1_MG-2023]